MKSNRRFFSSVQLHVQSTKPLSRFIFAFFVLAFVAVGVHFTLQSHAATIYYAGGQTYSDWYFPDSTGYNSLEWSFEPVADPAASLAQQGLLHYYAYNFSLANSSSTIGGGYAGFQTNGIFQGVSEGKVINYSIWGSNAAKSTGLINPNNTECGCAQIMYKFPWTLGHIYRFQLKIGPSGTDASGKWWGLWVTDQNTKVTTLIGEQRVPSTLNGLPLTMWSAHTSMFGEDMHWWKTLDGTWKYTNCTSFESSAMSAYNITANGTIRPNKFTWFTNSGQVNTASNGWQTTNCNVSEYTDSNFNVQHNLGYWATSAPNYIKTGDLNGDDVVNINDLSILLTNYNKTVTNKTKGDLNGDGVVNATDLSILLSHYGT